MAAYTVSTSKHATLVISTADTVTLTGSANQVTVVNHPGTSLNPIYFTVGDNPATAVVDADNTLIVFPGASYTVKFDGTPTKVSLIASTANKYSVIAS